MAQVIGVVGGSGGVGASTFAAVLAAAAGSAQSVLVDLDVCGGGVDVAARIEARRRRAVVGAAAGRRPARPADAARRAAALGPVPGAGRRRAGARPRGRAAGARRGVRRAGVDGGARPAARLGVPSGPRRCCAATSSWCWPAADVRRAGRGACGGRPRCPSCRSGSSCGAGEIPRAEAAGTVVAAPLLGALPALGTAAAPALDPRRLPRPALPGGRRRARRPARRARCRHERRPGRPGAAAAGREPVGRPGRRRCGAESAGIVDDAVFAELRRDVAAELHRRRSAGGRCSRCRASPTCSSTAPDSVWLDRGHGMERAGVAVRRRRGRAPAWRSGWPPPAGRRLDDALPFVDAVLPDGTRLHAVLPPLVAAAPRCRCGCWRGGRSTSTALVGAAGRCRRAWPRCCGRSSRPGWPSSSPAAPARGKTTLLGALLGRVPAGERRAGHRGRAGTRDRPPARGAAGVPGRQRRGCRRRRRCANSCARRCGCVPTGWSSASSAAPRWSSCSSPSTPGHEGSGATLHANSAADVPARFAALGALAGLPAPAVTSLVASAIDVVVHLRRGRDGRRAVAELALVRRCGDELAVHPVWTAAAGERPALTALHELLRAREGPR